MLNELRAAGAPDEEVLRETKRLYDLEAAMFKDIRRDLISKLRRPSLMTPTATVRKEKAVSLKATQSMRMPKPPTDTEG